MFTKQYHHVSLISDLTHLPWKKHASLNGLYLLIGYHKEILKKRKLVNSQAFFIGLDECGPG